MMQYLLRLTDERGNTMVVLTLSEKIASANAIDVVFDVIGQEDTDQLISEDILAAGQLDDLRALQSAIFDHDAQGVLIRDGVSFIVNGRELNPDAPMINSFALAERDGSKYMRCDVKVVGAAMPASGGASRAVPPGAITSSFANPLASNASLPNSASSSGASSSGSGASAPGDQAALIAEFARIMFLHQIFIGFAIDVTKDFPELVDIIKYAESNEWIEVDVSKVAYKLSAEGIKIHNRYIAEAQDLIRRFDIYSDVDIDTSGRARFDTGLGKDLRVPVFELEGVDPFRARFLLGINDGEWDQLSNWFELFENPKWYSEIFEPIERAPSVEDIGKARLASVIDQAKSELRQERPQQY